jgi:hypothetical protein
VAIGFFPLPFGMRDIKLTPYTDATATVLAGASIDLPSARTLTFAESEDFEDLRGDDQIQATHGSGPHVEWELEGGGTSMEAVQAMYGGTLTTTGVTPNQIKKLSKAVSNVRPYFKCEGQAISDSGGDMHMVIYRCKAKGDLKGEFGDGKFFLTGASGVGLASLLPASLGTVWDWVQNETATAIP